MKLTTNHAASSYGIPVFVDGGRAMNYAAGFHTLRKSGFSVKDIAKLTGSSTRTVEGWLQGRAPSTDVLLKLMHNLNRRLK